MFYKERQDLLQKQLSYVESTYKKAASSDPFPEFRVSFPGIIEDLCYLLSVLSLFLF